MNATELAKVRALSNEAYGEAVSTTDPTVQAYAAGIEDMCRWLSTGQYPTERFAAIARQSGRRQTV